MTIELVYLTSQFQRWLNLQIAHHLEAQAARLEPAEEHAATSGEVALRKLGAEGSGASPAEFGRMGMSGCYGPADGTESVAGLDDADAQTATLDGEKQAVHA